MQSPITCYPPIIIITAQRSSVDKQVGNEQGECLLLRGAKLLVKMYINSANDVPDGEC